jgi:hypothetical protein
VPQRCTCGATLPEDALFCHRCGKPQRELLAADPEPEPVIPPPIPVAPVALAAPATIGFHNSRAVLMALLAGVLSIVVLAIAGQTSIPQVLAPLLLIAGGFFAVYLYRRSTGDRLTPLNGAHLGWLAGVFGFLVLTVLLTISAVTLALEPSAASVARAQCTAAGRSEADCNIIFSALHNPLQIAVFLSMILLLFSILPAFGGALGAKFLDRADFARRD